MYGKVNGAEKAWVVTIVTMVRMERRILLPRGGIQSWWRVGMRIILSGTEGLYIMYTVGSLEVFHGSKGYLSIEIVGLDIYKAYSELPLVRCGVVQEATCQYLTQVCFSS